MIKKTIISILVILVAFLLQTTVFQVLKLANVVPNLLLVVTISYGYLRGRTHGMWIGLVCGMLLDMMYGSVIGLYAFIFMTIGFFIGYIKKVFFTDGILLPVILISIGDFVYGLYYYTTEFLLRGRLNIGFFCVKIIFPEMIYTILIGILLFYLINFIDETALSRRRRKEDTNAF